MQGKRRHTSYPLLNRPFLMEISCQQIGHSLAHLAAAGTVLFHIFAGLRGLPIITTIFLLMLHSSSRRGIDFPRRLTL